MKAGHNVFYNNSDGTNRDADRVGQALAAPEGGRVKVQTADSSVADFEAILHGLDEYDAEHDGNRGGCAWAVH